MKKRILNAIFLALFILPGFIVGCSDEDVFEKSAEMDETTEGFGHLNVQIGRNLTSDVVALEDEIYKVRVIAFGSGTNLIRFNKVFLFEAGYDPKKNEILHEIKTGNVDLFIIANETVEMAKTFSTTDLTADKVRKQIFALDELTMLSKGLQGRGLPMYKEVLNQLVKITHTENAPLLVEENIDRLMAKVTLSISYRTRKEVSLKSVQIKSLPNNSWLEAQAYAVASDEDNELAGGLEIVKLSESDFNTADVTKIELIEPLVFYIPEYIVQNSNKRSYIELLGKAKISEGGTVDCQYFISLGSKQLESYTSEAAIRKDIKGGELLNAAFDIKRNTHRIINVSDIKGYNTDKLAVLISVKDWDSANTEYNEGGSWMEQPTKSIRIAKGETTSFTAKFVHSTAPKIVYKWMRSQYKQEDAYPTIEELKTEILTKGSSSTYTFNNAFPDESGEIYCVAAPIGSTHFSESNHVTLMVVGDWAVENGKFPEMQNWQPKHRNLPLGTTYLLRDGRDNNYTNVCNVYRVKLMADGNWWMIQDLAYGEPVSLDEFDRYAARNRPSDFFGQGTYGVCCLHGEKTGGFLYDSFAATQKNPAWIGSGDDVNRYTMAQGICPDGWHLPGNLNAKFSEEINILDKAMFGLTNDKLRIFDYYGSFSFNGYTTAFFNVDKDYENLRIEIGMSVYHQGLASIQNGKYQQIGFACGDNLEYNDFEGGINDMLMKKVSFGDNVGAPIRCVKNYEQNAN